MSRMVYIYAVLWFFQMLSFLQDYLEVQIRHKYDSQLDNETNFLEQIFCTFHLKLVFYFY